MYTMSFDLVAELIKSQRARECPKRLKHLEKVQLSSNLTKLAEF